MKRESEQLDGDEVSRLAAIQVELRRRSAATKPVKVNRGAVQAWWLATHPLSEAIQKKEEGEEEQGLQEARTRPQDPDAELEPIRWPLNTRVGRDTKEGDVVVQVFTDGPASKRKTTVFAPASIVHRKVVETRARIYLQPLLSTSTERPLKKVLDALSKVGGILPGAKSAREISQQQVEAVASLFR